MSLSSSGNQGYLDVTNAILRVGTLDVYGITGVDMVTNVVKQNAVLVWDDQGADMSTPPFQLGAGVTRTTSPPEIDLRNASGDNFMYHGLKLPNQWMAQFDLYLDTGTTGNVHLQMYTSSTTTYDDDGYQFIFDAANSTLTLEYDGTQVQQSAVTYTTGWQTFVVTFNRGAWGVARESDVVFSLDDDERSAVYDNTSGQYLRFETDATTSRKVRYLKFTNSGPWLQSKTGDISFLTGNVSVGHHSTAHKLSVAGSANVGALTATSVNVAGGVDATSTSTGDLTLTGLGVESNIHTSNLYASGYVGVGTASAEAPLNVIGNNDLSGTPNNAIASFRATTAIPGTNDAGVVIGSVNGNLPYIADVSSASLGLSFYTQNNKRMIIKSDGNVAIGTHDPQYKLDVAGTANVGAVTLNSNVYAPNLPLAEIASNLVTWNSATGDLMDSGGLISNKLAIVSEQPPAALTGDSTVVDGHGRYKVTASSIYNVYEGYNIFSKIETDNWLSATDTYNSDGTYAASDSLGGISGEWVKLEMPYKTTLRHFTLRQDIDNTNIGQLRQFLVDFKVIASNDDTNWTTINTTTGVSTPAANDPALTVVVNANTSYKYYAIVVEKISAGANYNRCQIGEWRLFTETFTVDAGVVSTTAASGLDVGYTEHPVEPMTDYHTYVEGHGTYEASASSYDSTYSLYPWRAFDNNPSLRWTISTDDDNYNVSTGEWDQTAIDASPHVFTSDVGGTRYHGHWLQIKLPYAITLSHSNVHPTNTILDRPPKDGVILGSNDGDNWYKLTQFTGKTYTSATWTRIDVNATTPYQYFRMCATKNGGDSKLELTEWRLFAEKPVTRMENVHISGELSSETLQTGYIKWPRVPLKANESEGYVVSQSSSFNSNFIGFHAFEDKSEYTDGGTPSWASGSTSFSSGSAAVSRTTGSDTFYHEWLQIQLPQSIQLSYFNIIRRDVDNNKLNEAPKNGFMYGSNDGIAWTKLVSYSDLTYTDYTPTRVDVNSTNSYKYFRLAVTNTTYTSGAVAYTAINELQLFEAATGVGAAPTSAKLQVAGSLGMAKGAEFFAGDDVVMELPKHDRPLTKYPEVAMTAATTGGYTVSATSEFSSSYGAWRAFNGVYDDDGQVDSWQPTGGEKYSTANGTWIGGTGSPYAIALTTGTTIYGEWLQLQIPSKIKLKYMNFSPIHISSGTYDNLGPHRSPREGYILGSNDGTNWTPLKNWTGLDYSYWNQYERSFGKIDVNDTNYYKYFRLVWTRTVGGTYAGYASAQEVEYYGTEEGDTSVDVVHRSIPNKPGQQHLAVYWDANDSNSYSFADSSNVYDLSGNGRTGTLTNNVTFDSTDNGWITTSTTTSGITGSFAVSGGDWVHSVSYWVKVRALPPSSVDYLFGFASAVAYNSIAHYIKPDGTLVTGSWTLDYPTSNFTVPVGEWFHVTTTYQGGGFSPNVNAKTYINGELKNMGTNISFGTDGTALGIPTTAQVVYVGYGYGGAATTPEATYGNFRMYSNKALNADQVRELYEYDAPRFGHRQNLVALHKGCLGVGVAHPTSRFEIAGADGVQEFPPKAMTDFETYMEGHGVFKVHKSGDNTYIGDWPAWEAFNEVLADAYHGGNFYTGTDYAYAGTETLGGISGDYVILELPYKIKAKQISLAPYPTINRTPEDFTILGSNDNVNWTKLATFNGITNWTSGVYKSFNINSDEYFNHFAVVVTRLVADQYFMISEIKYYGTPAPSSLEDGHLTLGKALTLPRVSGHATGAETPRAESLVLHYDTTVDSVVSGSTVVDISGNGINGTLTNGAVYSSTNRALTFDGVNDYVSGTLPSSATGAWVHSVSFWFKMLDIGVLNILFAAGTPSSGNITGAFVGSTGAVRVYFYGYDFEFGQVNENQWYHLCYVYKGGTLSTTSVDIYLDNVRQEPSVPVSTYSGALNLTGSNFRISGDTTGNYLAEPFQMSNFKIWNVTLTAEEVAAEYALGRTGKALNLTDTALCLGGTVPRAQLDVRGSALFGGNVGIGTASPVALLNIQGLSQGAPPTSGGETISNGLFRIRDNYNVTLDVGTLGESPWSAWLQVADATNIHQLRRRRGDVGDRHQRLPRVGRLHHHVQRRWLRSETGRRRASQLHGRQDHDGL
jgi:hypothetical protein